MEFDYVNYRAENTNKTFHQTVYFQFSYISFSSGIFAGVSKCCLLEIGIN